MMLGIRLQEIEKSYIQICGSRMAHPAYESDKSLMVGVILNKEYRDNLIVFAVFGTPVKDFGCAI